VWIKLAFIMESLYQTQVMFTVVNLEKTMLGDVTFISKNNNVGVTCHINNNVITIIMHKSVFNRLKKVEHAVIQGILSPFTDPDGFMIPNLYVFMQVVVQLKMNAPTYYTFIPTTSWIPLTNPSCDSHEEVTTF
jgi:hypothetical protein